MNGAALIQRDPASANAASRRTGEKHLVATMLVVDRPEDASFYPQVGHNSSDPAFQAVYWRCIACFYASSVRQNGSDVHHAFFTNAERLPVVDGLDLDAFLQNLDVEVRRLPITRRLGGNRVSAWNNVFYILDIIDQLSRQAPFKSVTCLDSDCVWVRPGEQLFADIQRRGALTLSMPYAADQKVNGGSREDLGRAAGPLAGHPLGFTPNYAGGELFAVRHDRLLDIHRLAVLMWDRLLAAPPGAIDVYTEEHFLSIIYEVLDIPAGTADLHARRMWTALRLSNVSGEDRDSSRAIWHLPMEKKTGFADLFALVRDPGSWFWSRPPRDLRLGIARVMGIPNRTPRQYFLQARSRLQFHAGKRLATLMAPR